ncbi:TPA: hypothetical protein QCH65_000440 [Enterobacter roggenkampii]|nr:hypothetical protein [Enterobacter roggenkampii]
MTKEELLHFFEVYGVGEYQVSVLPGSSFIARPLTQSQVIADIDVLMEMIAARDAKSDKTDL